ncbi:MAG TPA: hypothetical protein PLW65_29320 [Pseudomonadota bacterium]|nr:hypothetical protein [Pseudomonadota bacterium]
MSSHSSQTPRALPSTKRKLHDAVDELPESLSLEEAVERLYLAFKRKQSEDAQMTRAEPLQPLPVLDGRVPEGWKDAIYSPDN